MIDEAIQETDVTEVFENPKTQAVRNEVTINQVPF